MEYNFNDIASMLEANVTPEAIAQKFTEQLNLAMSSYEEKQKAEARKVANKEAIYRASCEFADAWNYLADTICVEKGIKYPDAHYINAQEAEEMARATIDGESQLTKLADKLDSKDFAAALSDWFKKLGI